MDLFFANLPEKYRLSGKEEGGFGSRRVHFHQFMMDVHKKGHKIKMETGIAQDWVVLVAREIAKETRVLCFDEFQVSTQPFLDFDKAKSSTYFLETGHRYR